MLNDMHTQESTARTETERTSIQLKHKQKASRHKRQVKTIIDEEEKKAVNIAELMKAVKDKKENIARWDAYV